MNETTQLPCFHTAFYCRDRSSIPVVRKFTRKALIEWGYEERAYDVLLCVTNWRPTPSAMASRRGAASG